MRHDFARHFADFKATFQKTQIIENLKANREEHLKVYGEAKEGYLKKAAEVLQKRLAGIKEGELVALSFDLKVPVCYVEQYDSFIKMFENAKEDEFELDIAEYRCIVDDDWSWSNEFLITNSAYSATARSKF